MCFDAIFLNTNNYFCIDSGSGAHLNHNKWVSFKGGKKSMHIPQLDNECLSWNSLLKHVQHKIYKKL